MKDLLSIARKILEINEHASLTGTLMLKVRGIDLGRDPHDIDILIRDYAPNIKLPKEWNAELIGHSSDGTGAKYRYKDYIIDVISHGEEPEIVNGLRLGSVDGLIKAKLNYRLQNNPDAKKHHNDLVKLGYDFTENVDDNNIDLPF